jgi:hypothetical protein
MSSVFGGNRSFSVVELHLPDPLEANVIDKYDPKVIVSQEEIASNFMYRVTSKRCRKYRLPTDRTFCYKFERNLAILKMPMLRVKAEAEALVNCILDENSELFSGPIDPRLAKSIFETLKEEENRVAEEAMVRLIQTKCAEFNATDTIQ